MHNIKNTKLKGEMKMDVKNKKLSLEDVKVEDGKVIISSEELANAIQEQKMNLEGNEEAGMKQDEMEPGLQIGCGWPCSGNMDQN